MTEHFAKNGVTYTYTPYYMIHDCSTWCIPHRQNTPSNHDVYIAYTFTACICYMQYLRSMQFLHIACFTYIYEGDAWHKGKTAGNP